MQKDQIEKYEQFAKDKLGLKFNDINLLITALTHRSYVNEHRKTTSEHNERLEYLGDAVLELVTSDFLFKNFHLPEGIMTAIRAALVRTESIGDAGEKLGYAPLVRMSKGEKSGSARAHASILADCFEAVIGAIYLDQGYDAASDFIYKNIIVKMDQIVEDESWRDPKSLFQEICQHLHETVPQYRTLNIDGPDHDRTYTVGVFVNDNQLAEARGHSKHEAESTAAAQCIKIYKQKGLYTPEKIL